MTNTSNQEKENADNMRLWTLVCKTDESQTRQIENGLTGVNANYQSMIATKVMGPYGKAWGFSEHSYSTLEMGDQTTLIFNGKFFYTIPGEKESHDFEMTVDMVFEHGKDCYKILRTDAQSKCLYMLGFNADILNGIKDFGKYESQEPKAEEMGGIAKNEVLPKPKEKIVIEKDDKIFKSLKEVLKIPGTQKEDLIEKTKIRYELSEDVEKALLSEDD